MVTCVEISHSSNLADDWGSQPACDTTSSSNASNIKSQSHCHMGNCRNLTPDCASYLKDGNPKIEFFSNKSGLKIAFYSWEVKDPRAAIYAVHGISSHLRLEYLHYTGRIDVDELRTHNAGPEDLNIQQNEDTHPSEMTHTVSGLQNDSAIEHGATQFDPKAPKFPTSCHSLTTLEGDNSSHPSMTSGSSLCDPSYSDDDFESLESGESHHDLFLNIFPADFSNKSNVIHRNTPYKCPALTSDAVASEHLHNPLEYFWCGLCGHGYNCCCDGDRQLTYDGSWIEYFNRHGYSFYGIDLQGHGLSDSWNGVRCNVESFDDFVSDYLMGSDHLVSKLRQVQRSRDVSVYPIFLLGLSLGGCVSLRAAQVIQQNRLLIRDQFAGLILMSPMLCIDSIKNSPVNRLLLPLSRLLSYLVPHMPIAKKSRNKQYPWIDIDSCKDPLRYHSSLRSRIARESLCAIDTVMAAENIRLLSDIGLNILIIHSRNDTMCDPEGSRRLFDTLVLMRQGSQTVFDHIDAKIPPSNIDRASDDSDLWMSTITKVGHMESTCPTMPLVHDGGSKQSSRAIRTSLWILNNLWHAFPHEPGNKRVISTVVDWINGCIDNFQ